MSKKSLTYLMRGEGGTSRAPRNNQFSKRLDPLASLKKKRIFNLCGLAIPQKYFEQCFTNKCLIYRLMREMGVSDLLAFLKLS